MDTINRLLKKQPPKRGRKSAAALLEITESGQEEEVEVERANPLFVRYRQTREGVCLGVPEEWLGAPVGGVFAGKSGKSVGGGRGFAGRMVEEVV